MKLQMIGKKHIKKIIEPPYFMGIKASPYSYN